MAAITLSVSRYTALRVTAVVIPIGFAMGGSVAVFLAVPQVNDALRLALTDGGAAFRWLVILPASLMAVVTTVLVAKILWSASAPSPAHSDDTHSTDQA